MPDITALLNLLKDATDELPQLKFVWGLLGMSLVAAIIIRIFGNTEGTPIIIGLTIVGAIITFVTIWLFENSSLAKRPAQVLIWAVTIFFVIFLGFTALSYSFGLPCNWSRTLGTNPHQRFCSTQNNNEFSEEQQATLSELRNACQKVTIIMVRWEQIDELGQFACKEVRKDASTTAKRVESIQDNLLSNRSGMSLIGEVIEKYYKTQYAYLMASDVECDEKEAKKYALNSIKHGEYLAKKVEEALSLSNDQSGYIQRVKNWLTIQSVQDRSYFLTALAYGILNRLGNQNVEEQVNKNLKQFNLIIPSMTVSYKDTLASE